MTPLRKIHIILSQVLRSATHAVVKDWRTRKYLLFAALLAICTTLLVVIYYANHPGAEPQADTWSYLYVVNRIQTQGQPVNFWRLPGYPLFIVLIYTLIGEGNLAAVSAAQAVLFVLATLELYVLALLVLRRAWVAFLIGLLVGLNIPLLSYMKPIMSEALGLWLLVSLTLLITLFLSKPRALTLWLVTVFALLLVLTRAEWVLLPLPLFAYLLLIAVWKGKARRLFLHALASVALLYAVLGGYMYINTTQNHYSGITWIENINMLGKVLQYHMQDEAPPQYAGTRRILDSYVAKGVLDPYPILAHEPSLSRNYAAPAGEFSQTIIEHHPGEFLVKSVPVFFSSLTDYHEGSSVAPGGLFGPFLIWLQALFRALYGWNILFPPCALIWIFMLCLRRTRKFETLHKMGALVLLSLYGLISTTLGAYRGDDYMRIHTLFDPLMSLVIWGTLLTGVLFLIRRVLRGAKGPFHNQVKVEGGENVLV